MKIEQSFDKVLLTNEEVQEVLRGYVESKIGRKVRGHVVINHQQERTSNSVLQCSPVTSGAGFCYLQAPSVDEHKYVKGA